MKINKCGSCDRHPNKNSLIRNKMLLDFHRKIKRLKQLRKCLDKSIL